MQHPMIYRNFLKIVDIYQFGKDYISISKALGLNQTTLSSIMNNGGMIVWGFAVLGAGQLALIDETMNSAICEKILKRMSSHQFIS